uniref:Uncharacterized protein n=1 Tax=Anopheles dirus TaxID=7168 RepID=A0A182NWH7_9DIPT
MFLLRFLPVLWTDLVDHSNPQITKQNISVNLSTIW